MKKLSIFKISLIIVVCGAIWIGFEFLSADSIVINSVLNPEQTSTFQINLQESSIGFYKTTVLNYDRDSIFVQIINPQGNVIADKKIETKGAVNYFVISEVGTYRLVATNLSNDDLQLEIEFGDTGELRYPAIVIFLGLILLWVSSYRRLRDHKMAHPEEKIS